jgi:hypothetical protein
VAEFVTKKENTRRLMIIILCVMADAVALAVGIYALKKAGDIEKKPENPENIVNLRAEVEKQRAVNKRVEDILLEFGPGIGWRTEARGTSDRFVTAPLGYAAMKKYLSDWAVELNRQYGIKNHKRWDDPGQGENLTLTRLLDVLLEKENEFKAKIADLEGKIKAEREKEDASRKAAEEENKGLIDKITGGAPANQDAQGLIGELKRLQKDLNALEKAHREELATLEPETIAKQTESTNVKNENVRKRAAHEATKADLRKRIYSIQHVREEARERREADGEILSVDENRQICHINLLHKDRLWKGTKFTVYSLEKGGEKIDKGQLEVIEVRPEISSVCAILSTRYPDWPLKAGDKVYNEFYEGGRPRYIALAGRFSGKLSNEEAAAMIRRFGDFYQEKVDDKTNYVVVAEGYEEAPNYKLALEFGVKILREKILYDYLGVK